MSENKKLWTPGAVCKELANREPDAAALHFLDETGGVITLSRAELDDWSDRVAVTLSKTGVTASDRVAIHLPTCPEHVVATLAAYKLGACPTPVSDRMPVAERDGLIALAEPKAIVSDAPELHGITRSAMAKLPADPSRGIAGREAVPQPAKAIASGGSTGKPKLIVSPGAFAFPWQAHPLAAVLDFRPGDLVYSPGPLFHNQAFFFSQIALFQGATIALNARFNAELALSFVESLRPSVLNVVPTMMQRMLRTEGFKQRDLSSIRRLWHLAAPCPEWAKLGWMEAIGDQRVWELWAATEITGLTTISGEEWRQHRGSVGRGVMTDIKILDSNGQPCPPGTVGEIYSRFGDGSPQYHYLGASPLPEVGEGYRSVGDLGYVDESGYLYLADRRTDLIISGGSNVYPAEVEAVISALPGVRDVAVIGVPDEDLGRRVHAVVEVSEGDISPEAILTHCAEHLARYKIPHTLEFATALPRNEAGKIRRSALLSDRA